MIVSWKDSVIKFAQSQLNKFQPRDDYCELLELSFIFLGGTPERGIRFRYPSAIHRACWIARTIYSTKMWLLCKQYTQAPAVERFEVFPIIRKYGVTCKK